MMKTKEQHAVLWEGEYLKRLKTLVGFEIIELAGATISDANQAQREDRERLFSRLGPRDFLVVLDEVGEQFTSEKFSKFIETKMNAGAGTIVFAIGGAYGWDHQVRKRADLVWSLASLTFPYQVPRLLVVEQIYRACTLIKGLPYHKR